MMIERERLCQGDPLSLIEELFQLEGTIECYHKLLSCEMETENLD